MAYVEKLPVTCLDCGYHFSTVREVPRCPQCKSDEIVDRDTCEYPSEEAPAPILPDTWEEARGEW